MLYCGIDLLHPPESKYTRQVQYWSKIQFKVSCETKGKLLAQSVFENLNVIFSIHRGGMGICKSGEGPEQHHPKDY